MTVKNVKYSYKDSKYGAVCINVCPQIEVRSDDYEDVLNGLRLKVPECTDLKIWSLESDNRK